MKVTGKISQITELLNLYSKIYRVGSFLCYDRNNHDNKIIHIQGKEHKIDCIDDLFKDITSQCFMDNKNMLAVTTVSFIILHSISQIRYHRYSQMIFKVLVGPVTITVRKYPMRYVDYIFKKESSQVYTYLLPTNSIIVLQPYTHYQFIVNDTVLLGSITLQYINSNYDCSSTVYLPDSTIAIYNKNEL